MTTFTVLAGGVGSARFLAGLVQVVEPEALTVIVNTGDDERIRGLHISPDIDTVLYHLGGLCEWDRGWGLADESYTVNDRYRELASRAGIGEIDLQDWFLLGDGDLATHLLRTRLLDAGLGLAAATDAVRRALGVPCRVLPVTEMPLRTVFRAASGQILGFQEYFVRHRQEPDVDEVSFVGADAAVPAPGVLEALERADVVLIPPSNPLISVMPMLAVPGVREALAGRGPARVGVSPIVGGRALKGPADRLLARLGHDVSPAGVAGLYRDFLDAFVVDAQDAPLADEVERLGMRAPAIDTIMGSAQDAARVAKGVIDSAVH